ncbi:hypothetical protein HKD37_19G052718 [Glycine soja]
MGSNQAPSSKKRFYHVKVKNLELASLRELGQQMDQVRHQAFSKAYGKIWDLTMIEVSVEAIASLAQYYDQSLRCFTFGDFQLVLTIEEFEGILGCPLGGMKSYLFFRFHPSMARVAKVVKISAQELDRVKQNKNGVVGIPRKRLEEKAEALANQGEWTSFINILALLVFGTILFPNVDELVDLAAIDAFLAYHHSKESPVIAVLANAYDTFDLRCEKSDSRIVCCTPALFVWLVSHVFHHEGLSGKEAEVPKESEEVQALKVELEKTRAVKEKLKTTITRVKKECDELRNVNMTTIEALERETKRARKEEWSRNKFRRALWGSSNELKLRRAERDESKLENMVLEDKLKACQRFALTLNGGQELPRLLARAKAMADVYSAPDEVHGLFDYYQHMVELMSHIIRNR